MDWSKVKPGDVVKYNSQSGDDSHPVQVKVRIKTIRPLTATLIWSSKPTSGDYDNFNPAPYGWELDESYKISQILGRYESD